MRLMKQIYTTNNSDVQEIQFHIASRDPKSKKISTFPGIKKSKKKKSKPAETDSLTFRELPRGGALESLITNPTHRI